MDARANGSVRAAARAVPITVMYGIPLVNQATNTERAANETIVKVVLGETLSCRSDVVNGDWYGFVTVAIEESLWRPQSQNV